MKNKSAIQSLIVLAGKNLQENPSSVAESLLDGLRALESEYDALLAVVEATEKACKIRAGTSAAMPHYVLSSIAQLHSITKG